MFKFKKMRETILAYKRVFGSPDGKLVLNDLMRSCHVMNSTFDRDANEMLFNEGARSVVLRILKTIETDMDNVKEMITKLEEHEKEQEEQQNG